MKVYLQYVLLNPFNVLQGQSEKILAVMDDVGFSTMCPSCILKYVCFKKPPSVKEESSGYSVLMLLSFCYQRINVKTSRDVDDLLMGMASQIAEKVDNVVVEDLTGV